MNMHLVFPLSPPLHTQDNVPELVVLLDVCEGLVTVTEELRDEDPLGAT